VVTVGQSGNNSTWSLPKKLLTHHSPFFAAALDGNFAEANSKAVSLPDEKPMVFEAFVQWLYIGHFKVEHGKVSSEVLCAEAWILGNKIACLPFQDHAMLQLINLHEKDCIDPTVLELAYTATTENSKLRSWALAQFMCDSFTLKSSDADDWQELSKKLDGFAVDVINCLRSKRMDSHPNPYTYPGQFLEVIGDHEATSFLDWATEIDNLENCAAYD